MNVSVATAKAPWVVFEKRPVEDRTRTIEGGVYATKDVDFVIVTPAGSKDRHEAIASEWFANMEKQVREERLPPEWLQMYQERYKAWQRNEEIPINGTPIKNWGILSPSQRANCITMGVVSVEALAEANEEVIGRLGMGGRRLVDLAKDFVSAKDRNKMTAGMEDLRAQFSQLRTENDNLREQNKNLSDMVKKLRSTEGGQAAAVGAGEDLDDYTKL